MADTAETEALSPDLRRRIIEALQSALMRLGRDRRSIHTDSPCSDLWDDSLELIELLMAIEEELQNGLRSNHELDWRSAPPRSATVDDFIEWIEREITNG